MENNNSQQLWKKDLEKVLRSLLIVLGGILATGGIALLDLLLDINSQAEPLPWLTTWFSLEVAALVFGIQLLMSSRWRHIPIQARREGILSALGVAWLGLLVLLLQFLAAKVPPELVYGVLVVIITLGIVITYLLKRFHYRVTISAQSEINAITDG